MSGVQKRPSWMASGNGTKVLTSWPSAGPQANVGDYRQGLRSPKFVRSFVGALIRILRLTQ